MEKVKALLEGKKTYVGIAAGVVYSVLIALSVVPQNEVVWGVIVAWTGVSFRMALQK